MYTLLSYYFTYIQANTMGRMSIETRMRVIGLGKLHFSLKDIQAKLKDEYESARNLYAFSSRNTRRLPVQLTELQISQQQAVQVSGQLHGREQRTHFQTSPSKTTRTISSCQNIP